MVLGATAVTPWGEVRVFVTHLTNGDPEVNRAQAESLTTFVRSHNEGLAVIAGDFNATEDSPQIQAISRQAVDTFRVTQPQRVGNTCCLDDLSSGPSESLKERIDYIFLFASPRDDLRAPTCMRILDRPYWTSRGWLWISDHAGLLATFWTD